MFNSLYQQDPKPSEGLMYETGFTEYPIKPASQYSIRKAYVDTADNGLLKERVSLLERSGMEKDYIIRSQNGQIGALGEIIDKKDAMLMNCEAMMEGLKAQIAAEQKARKKYMLYGAGVGVAVVGVVMVLR